MSGDARLGGDWLVRDTDAADVRTPDDLGDDHRLIARTAAEFVAREVAPAVDDLERKDWTVARRLLARAGDLGLLAADLPETAGGAGLDTSAALLVADAIGAAPSFSMAFGGQVNLAILPVAAFGTDDQRDRYLPGLLAGTTVGAYCLSEAGSGSDALGARTRAVRQPDAAWILSGEKLWVSNAGFADLFVVFAKADGDAFSAFLVERTMAGVAIGREEHKMGLHGSSTAPVVLDGVRVPDANVLGAIGRGHKVAFNVLNYGRLKLAATCTGGAKAALAEAAAYASARRQFGQPLASFGAIRQKLGAMAARLFAVESALHRTAGLLDAQAPHDRASAAEKMAALEECAIEASLLKIAGSEMLDRVVDDEVQIFGGNGFVRDYPAERRYRDARVNRIFEGTNEINRLLAPALWLKRAARHGWDAGAPPVGGDANAPATAMDAAIVVRMAARAAIASAARAHGEALGAQQPLMLALADLLIAAYLAESSALRASRAASSARASIASDAASIAAADACVVAHTALQALRNALPAGAWHPDAGPSAAALAGVRIDALAARDRLADAVLHGKTYPFS